MIKNIGPADRIIRLIAGLTLIYVAISYYPSSMILGIILGILGIIFIFTAVSGFCMIYKLLNFNTNLDQPAQPRQPAQPAQQEPAPAQNQAPQQQSPQQQPQQPSDPFQPLR